MMNDHAYILRETIKVATLDVLSPEMAADADAAVDALAARCDALENALRVIRDYRLGGNPDADVMALNKTARDALAATEKKSSEEEPE